MDLEKNPSSQWGNKYDVFLSFRGEDIRESFATHLSSSLREAGISIKEDDNSIELSQRNIEGSKISIIIFSKHYAGSKWCLEELTRIMEFHRAYGQVIIPIFYGVEPVEVRNQKFGFGAVFQDLITRTSPTDNEVSRWRMALNEAGCISGFIVPIFETRYEGEIVKEVIEHVSCILDKKDLYVADHPVGVDNRVKEVINMLQKLQSENVVMVGIWGMAGVGKTTLAKAIYNEIGPMFEGKSYLSNIRKVWDNEQGPLSLQNQLLSEICKTTKIKLNSIEIGKTVLGHRLSNKQALVVLDDVDKSGQLNALAGSPDWFGKKSIIIITSRDKHLLLKMCCHVYEVKVLDMEESIELLSWHAFKQKSPPEDFRGLSKDIAEYAGGLPLALEVLGSYLYDKEAEEWESAFKKLKRVPSHTLQMMLKTSFDSLDDLEKKIFLDISCFFIGMDRNDVIQILNGCGFFAEVGIRTLVDRSLLIIDEKNKLGMHDLLRDMGREIIRQESPDKLGMRSRLWFHADSLEVLSSHTGTNGIEGLSLKWTAPEVHFETKAFKNMKRLRLLCLDNVKLSGDYKYISKNLRWLCWHHSPIEYIPSSFCQDALVAIDLQFNRLGQAWKEPMLLEMLKILNLSHSPCLVQTPDFSYLPNLEQLILKDCPGLSEIHPSVGLLNCLVLLDLEDCTGLHALPISIYGLKYLKTLNLSGCLQLEKQEGTQQMESLTTPIAPSIKNTEPKQHSLLMEDELIVSDSLRDASSCRDISKAENDLGHLLIQIGEISEVFRALSERISQGLNITKYSDDCILPDNYPYWLTFNGEGVSVKFKVPPINDHENLKGVAICCIYVSSSDLGNKACEFCINSLMIINYTKSTTLHYHGDQLTSLVEESKEVISNLEADDEMDVIVVAGKGFIAKKTAVYLIYNESFDEQIKPSISDPKHKCENEEDEAHQSKRPKKVMEFDS